MELLIAVGAAAAFVLVGMALARIRRRAIRVAVAVLAPLLVVAFAVWWVFLRPDVLPAVWVYPPGDEPAIEFRVTVANTRIQMTGIRNTFRPVGGTAELMAAVRRDHPQAVVTGDTAHVVENNQGFVLHPADDRPDAYTLEAESIRLTRADQTYWLPFPSLSVTSIDAEGWSLTSTCDQRCLTSYYGSFSNAHPSADGLTITTSQGSFMVRALGRGRYLVTQG